MKSKTLIMLATLISFIIALGVLYAFFYNNSETRMQVLFNSGIGKPDVIAVFTLDKNEILEIRMDAEGEVADRLEKLLTEVNSRGKLSFKSGDKDYQETVVKYLGDNGYWAVVMDEKHIINAPFVRE